MSSDIARLRRANEEKANELKRVNRAHASLEKELSKVQRELHLIQEIKSRAVTPHPYKIPPLRNGDKSWHATPIFISSDLQAGEVVLPQSLHNYNAYDLAIARMRFRHTAESVVLMTRDGMPNYVYDGIVVVLNGDPISNNIHEELQETNQGTVLETVLFAFEEHIAMLDLFLEAFPSVFVVSTPSNHGRYHVHKKTPHKQQSHNSFDWLIAKMLQDHYKADGHINFHVSDASDAQFKVYDKVYAAEHGHMINATGQGVSGIAPAISRAVLQRSVRDQKMGRPTEFRILSHYHQLVQGPDWALNGSYIGYTEMPYDLAMSVQVPQQGLLIAVPERGVTVRLPIDCEAPGERKLWPTAGRNSW